MYLNTTERQRLILTLSENQKHALYMYSRLSQQSYFANVLASYKGTERYEFEGFIDHGSVSKDVKCLCGKFLRYEFILKDLRGNRRISLGRTHFQKELDIPDHIARQVHHGIHIINLELDEILHKHDSNDFTLPPSILKYIDRVKLAAEIKCLLDAKLPLLRRHLDYLFDVTKKHRLSGNVQAKTESISHELTVESMPNSVNIPETYGKVIDNFFKKSEYPKDFTWRKVRKLRNILSYQSVHGVIQHLLEHHGLENQLKHGQHILYRQIKMYLVQNPSKFKVRPEGYDEFIYIAEPGPTDRDPEL